MVGDAPYPKRNLLLIAGAVGLLACSLAALAFGTGSYVIEIDLASGRERHTHVFLGIPLQRWVEDTSFSNMLVKNGLVDGEEEWRVVRSFRGSVLRTPLPSVPRSARVPPAGRWGRWSRANVAERW